jgi:hypothetical protein
VARVRRLSATRPTASTGSVPASRRRPTRSTSTGSPWVTRWIIRTPLAGTVAPRCPSMSAVSSSESRRRGRTTAASDTSDRPASGRVVTRTSTGTSGSDPVTKRSTQTVEASATCRSSRQTRTGPWWVARRIVSATAEATATRSPAAPAPRTGPGGRDMSRPHTSHQGQRSGIPGTSRQVPRAARAGGTGLCIATLRTDVLPTPASPSMTTRRPHPEATVSAHKDLMVASTGARPTRPGTAVTGSSCPLTMAVGSRRTR